MNINLEEYRPLIAKVARLNKHPRVDIEDAISIATLALYRASELYDENAIHTAKFTTYAIAAMKYEVWHLKPNTDDNEVPLKENHLNIAIAFKDEYKVWMVSMLKSKLELLDTREKFIITGLFGIDKEEMTLEEIAKELGICHQRVWQIKNKALRKLKGILNSALTPLSA